MLHSNRDELSCRGVGIVEQARGEVDIDERRQERDGGRADRVDIGQRLRQDVAQPPDRFRVTCE